MRIVIASTIAPFIGGGAVFIVDWLETTLRERGYKVEVLKIPFNSNYKRMPEQMLALRLLDIQQSTDLLITIRTPSYIIQHPNKVVWFIHHHRGAYDLWGTEYQDLPNNSEGLAYRELIMAADNQYLPEAKKIFTNSQVVTNRLKKFNDIDSHVLYPPLLHPERFRCETYGDYIFYPSRVTNHKRQLLLIESMRYTKSAARVIIAGNIENPAYDHAIYSCIEKYQLQSKVELINRWISEQEKIDMIANSLAGAYLPFDEDSYGYPTLEFYHSEKPVITCLDSGGTLELIQDGINGYVCPPDPEAIAEKIDVLYANKKNAEQMGKNAKQSLQQLNINWDHVVASLTT